MLRVQPCRAIRSEPVDVIGFRPLRAVGCFHNRLAVRFAQSNAFGSVTVAPIVPLSRKALQRIKWPSTDAS